MVLQVSDITAIHITLEIDEKRSLFILLADDGSVTRDGSGSFEIESDPRTGKAPDLFEQTRMSLTDDLLNFMGEYQLPDQKGAACLLSIRFQFDDGSEDGFDFRFGSESQGPPAEINHFVRKAVDSTETWYRTQEQSAAPTQTRRKPWWKLW